MVEIRWVLEQGGQAIEPLTSIAEFCLLAARAAEGAAGEGDTIVTIGLSLLGVQHTRGDEDTIAAVEETWARREWVIPPEGG